MENIIGGAKNYKKLFGVLSLGPKEKQFVPFFSLKNFFFQTFLKIFCP